jgi:DNA-binding MarR family transcriptional regulator
MKLDLEAVERARALSDLALAVYRAHGALLAQGDAIVAPLGLSGARWQVLGAIVVAGEALSVPAIARSMGLSRQAIQKQVDLLEQEGLVLARPNPAHGRSPLFQLTGAGRAAFARADQRWSIEAAQLTEPLALSSLKAATRLLEQLSERLRSRADNDVSTE